MVDPERKILRQRSSVGGKQCRTTVIEVVAGFCDTRGGTMKNAAQRVRRWLEDVRQVDDERLLEDYRLTVRSAYEAMFAATCRVNVGWTHACLMMGWRASEPCIMLDCDDGYSIARFCPSGEEPCYGTMSVELEATLRSKTSARHLVSKRSVLDPGPTFTFGPPPIIRIWNIEISAIMRLRGIADAFDRHFELIPSETGDLGWA